MNRAIMVRGARRGIALAAFVAASAAQTSAQDEAGLAGVWGCERVLPAAIAGPVSVLRSGGRWRARASGFTADGTGRDGTIAFRFTGGRGELRVLPERERAYWIQPPSPAGYGPYASPLRLARSGPSSWRGKIVPLPARVEAYLVLAPRPDGTLTGFVRDPNRNAGLRFAVTRVALDGSRLRLFTANREVDGTFDAQRQTISIALPGLPGSLELTRRDTLHATGLYPRTPMPAHAAATEPRTRADGWPTASLAAVGMRRAPIDALLDGVVNTPVSDARAPYVQSILVARHGKLVVDEYFAGFSADRPHDMRSAGKTLADALAGIAAYRGAPIGEDTLVAPFYRAYAPFAHGDPRKERITLGDLLAMSSGFACDDNDDDSPGREDLIQSTTGDWYRATLDLPLASDPGSRGVYCSMGMNLAGGVIAGATRTWLPAFFDEGFAEPLGFGPYYVPVTPTGTMYFGGGEYVAPRDFLKLGQLFANGGRWHGRRVLGSDWVARSLRPHAALSAPADYGLAWHIYRFSVNGKTYVAEEAGGNGGQMLFVIRELDLVVMITAANYGDFRTWSTFADLVPRYVIPAAL